MQNIPDDGKNIDVEKLISDFVEVLEDLDGELYESEFLSHPIVKKLDICQPDDED
jgi:hypothetical protein